MPLSLCKEELTINLYFNQELTIPLRVSCIYVYQNNKDIIENQEIFDVVENKTLLSHQFTMKKNTEMAINGHIDKQTQSIALNKVMAFLDKKWVLSKAKLKMGEKYQECHSKNAEVLLNCFQSIDDILNHRINSVDGETSESVLSVVKKCQFVFFKIFQNT